MEWLYWTNKMGYDVGQLMSVIMATLHFAKFVAMFNFFCKEIGNTSTLFPMFTKVAI